MVDNLYAFREDLSREGIFFCFSGPISQDLLVEIGATLKQKMKLEEASNSTVIRVFSMVIEKAQNIIHYSAETIQKNEAEKQEEELKHGIIAVGCENGNYFVMCGNMIRNEEVGKLRSKLVKLQKMNKDDLKKYYKEQRRKEPEESSKGAGLGLIEVAKKAGRPIEFNFKKIDDSFSFFSTKTVI